MQSISTEARKLVFAAVAYLMAFVFISEHFQKTPQRSELRIVQGVIASSGWQRSKRSRFLIRVNTSPLWFQIRDSLMPDNVSISDIAKPGAVVQVGHVNASASLGDPTIDALLFAVNGREIYGPELISQRIHDDRSLSFSIAGILATVGSYLVLSFIRGRANVSKKAKRT